MTDAIAVDVGNTRIKWGLVRAGACCDAAALPADDATAWQQQLAAWRPPGSILWIVAGVHPARQDQFVAWLASRQARVRRLSSYRDLPLTVKVERPEGVGIDRLLDAVAAQHRRPQGTPAVIVDAGSAVTVDYLDAEGAFRGGAIYPGLRLMARALHEHTALLPLVEVDRAVLPPAPATVPALVSGIYHAVLGGAERLIAELARHPGVAPVVYLTGGDAALLAARLQTPHVVWPTMTLEGIWYSGSAA